MQKLIEQIPIELRETHWCRALVELVTEQSKLIQEQSLLLQAQKEEIAALKVTLQALKDEVARVKKLPKRPKFRPPGGKPRERRGLPDPVVNNSGAHELTPAKLKEEIMVKAEGVPDGSRFKGYQNYIVKDVQLVVKEITYRLEVWQATDGRIIHASLPEHLKGAHFGPELRGLIHNLYAACMTEPEIYNLLTGFGVEISTGQIHNILMNEVEKLCEVSDGILKAGLETAPYIGADDTGAKHEYKAEYCTYIGGQYFAFFKTSRGKSRANFLEILLQGQEGYYINEAFMRHIAENSGKHKEKIFSKLEAYKGEQYETLEDMEALLKEAGIKNKSLRFICIEAGLIGFISQTMMRANQILLSDRAGQFAIMNHSACWVHMERPLRALVASQKELEQTIQMIRGMIWDLYDKVKIASVTKPGKEADSQREEINVLYDNLIAVKTTSLSLRAVITSFADYRDELLKPLYYPGLPLHNNASEGDIRSIVKRRNVSGSTKSDDGKLYRDALATIKQTCRRLGISFFGYMKQWFSGQPIDLAVIIRNKYRDALETPQPQLSG